MRDGHAFSSAFLIPWVDSLLPILADMKIRTRDYFTVIPVQSAWLHTLVDTLPMNTWENLPSPRLPITIMSTSKSFALERLSSAGSLSTGAFAFAIANSRNLSAWAQISLASVQATVIAQTRITSSIGIGPRAHRKRPPRKRNRHLHNASASQLKRGIEPGTTRPYASVRR